MNFLNQQIDIELYMNGSEHIKMCQYKSGKCPEVMDVSRNTYMLYAHLS